MAIVHWSSRALGDRRRQLDYIAADNVSAAVGLGDRIESAVDVLYKFPELGRPGRKSGTRELVITGTPFLAIYRVRAKTGDVEILRFLHGARRWPPRPTNS